MSKQLGFFWALTVQDGASIQAAGSLDAPVKLVTIDAEGTQRKGEEIPIPAGGSVTVYTYSDQGPWDSFIAQIRGGEGFLFYTLDLDSPESADDPTASGDHEATTPKLGLSCTHPLVFSTRSVKVNGNATDGFIYGITLYNPGATDLIAMLWSN